MSDKVTRLLATLRGEAPPEEEAPAFGDAAAPAVSEEALSPLKDKIAALEAKLEALAAPPPPEDALPPQPPTELTVWLHTRMELLEKRLEMAQQEALRANLLMREREEAQRKAQKEVEDLFRSIKEANRSAIYDKELRDGYQSAQVQMAELQSRLRLAELRTLPAEEVARAMATEEGRAELAARLQEQLARAEAAQAEAPAPPPWTAPPKPQAAAPASMMEARAVMDEKIALLLGRISDLEHRLSESERLRREEEQNRRRWEADMLNSLGATRRQWQKAGGPDILVEAALETMVGALKDRDAAQAKTASLITQLQDEPLDSPKTPVLRAELALVQEKMRDLQVNIDRQMGLVKAWIARSKGS